MPKAKIKNPYLGLTTPGAKALKDLVVACRVAVTLAVPRTGPNGFYETAMELDLADHKALTDALAAFEPYYRKATT